MEKELKEIGKQMKIANMIKLAYHQGQNHPMCDYWTDKIEKKLKDTSN